MNSVRVADVAEQIRGVSFSKSDSIDKAKAGFLPVLTASNITEDGLTLLPLQYVPSSRIADRQKLRLNDVVVTASSGSLSVVGRAALVKEHLLAGFGAFCKVLRPGPLVDPNYFIHYFRTPAYRAEASRLAAGANINNLRNEDLDGLRLPLPPLPEQRRIADILGRADELRAKRRQSLGLLDELADAIFIDMFGDPSPSATVWPCTEIGKVLLSAKYGSSKKAGQVGKWPTLRMGNITVRGDIDTSDLKYMDMSEAEEAKYLVRRGDLLFNRTNSSKLVGKTAAYRSDEPMAFAGYLVRLRPDPLLATSEFISAFLNSDYGKARLHAMAKSIVGMANINAQEVQSIVIPMPPVTKQQAFADNISVVEKLKAEDQCHLAKLDELFVSLQHRAFSGQL